MNWVTERQIQHDPASDALIEAPILNIVNEGSDNVAP